LGEIIFQPIFNGINWLFLIDTE